MEDLKVENGVMFPSPGPVCTQSSAIIMIVMATLPQRSNLQDPVPTLLCPYPYGVLDWDEEDFPIADIPGICYFTDEIYDLLGFVIRDYYFDLCLRDEIHHIFSSPLLLGNSFLLSPSPYFGNRH